MTHTPEKIRIALIGCGQIADAHLSQLQRLKSAEVVGVCDVHYDLAWQAAARFHVPGIYTSIDRMIEETRPEVVHITTPAQTHAPLTLQLLQSGCHVYVEKPFTLHADESSQVLEAAIHAGRRVCVGHDQLFDPLWLQARAWIERGVIGPVQHIESILGYPLAGSFGSLVAANPQHWVRQLPGGLFQNTISHPLYRLTDLMTTDQPEIRGGWWTRPGFDFPTEMQITLIGERQTAGLTFSTLLSPQRVTRVYGSTATLDLDLDTQTIRLNRHPRLPGALGRLEGAWQQGANGMANVGRTLSRFLRSDLHYFAGMKNLFERFYHAIRNESPMPIPESEAHRVTLLMDRIFAHCRREQQEPSAPAPERELACR